MNVGSKTLSRAFVNLGVQELPIVGMDAHLTTVMNRSKA